MSSPAPQAPPGWYDDATHLGIKRYWDGSAWTDRTAAAGDVPRDLDRLDHRGRVPVIVAIVAVLVAVAALVFALTKPVEVRVVEAVPSASPSPSAITVPPGNYTAFVRDATRDLDDFDKDLDDVEKTIDDGGFWRLLSNTAELRFNLEQLRTTTAPGFLSAEWDDSLDDIDDALQDLATAIEGTVGDQRDALQLTRDESADARALVELLE